MAETVDVVIDGGACNAGPLGPALGPTGVNIGEVVAEINQKTAEFKGMKVPVKIEVDDKRGFTVSVGLPPASALIKEKLGLKSGSGNAKTTFVSDMSWDQLKSIARMKGDNLMGADLRRQATEIVGTCTSMGVTIEGMNPREASKRLRAGEFDAQFE